MTTTTWRRCGRVTAPLLLLAVLACEDAPISPSADARQNSTTARIEGNVVITGPARGNVVLFLFSADRPPPPEGTGRPLSFTFLRAEDVFRGALADETRTGPFIAPYAFSLVPEGRYLIRGFIDRNGCINGLGCRAPDFIPWYGVTAEPNAADVGGAAVDAATRRPQVIHVSRRDDGTLAAALDVQVSFAESATLPVDRPAFRVTGPDALDLQAPFTALELTPEKMIGESFSLTAPALLGRFVDEDADGVPDDRDGNGAPDVWPRVFLRKLSDAPPGLRDENDADRNGVLDDVGADYVRADGTTDGLTDAVVLAAAVRTDPIIAALTRPDGTLNMGAVPLPKLEVLIRPLALDARDPAKPVPLKEVPKGRYAVVVMNFTGQTWRVPNELAPAIAEQVGLLPVASQAWTLEVR